MKLNNIGYLIKEGIRGIFLHGFMSFAAVCITVACLLITGTFYSLTYNIGLMVEDLNKTNEILVYIDEQLPYAEALSVGTDINLVDNVLKATFKSREEALEDFIADHEGDEAFSGVEAQDLRHRYIVVLEDNSKLEQTVEEIKQIPGVAKISAAYELAEGFAALESVLSIASLVIIVALMAVSVVIISNTVKLGMYDRRDEIAIMKMVGATNGFIRMPYIVEGFLLGIIGAGAAFGLEWLLYDWALNELNSMDTLKMLSLVPFEQMLVPMVIMFSAAGLLVGIVGSGTSIRKFMDV